MVLTLSLSQLVSVRTAVFVRGKICEYLGYLGITIDAEQNSKRGEDIIISTPDSKVTVCVIPTNEELMIARDTKALVEAQ